MENNILNNVNIISKKLLLTPQELHDQYPADEKIAATVTTARNAIRAILKHEDKRLLTVVGPCSIHDVDAALEYANKLASLSKELNDSLLIVMRVYFEKPRTTVGWKGLINDPDMNDSFHITAGYQKARALLCEINRLGLPVGTEALDPVTPQFLDDLISWTAIGARTVESQTHREMASGLSTPVGFKNGTDGSISVAINAMKAASKSHHFLGVNSSGQLSIFHTAGNPFGHLVLRGGTEPNYDSVHIKLCEQALDKAELQQNIMVDCSHGNSKKQAELQPLVLDNCISQIEQGASSIIGVMLESNLEEGKQTFQPDRASLKYGVSITDACIDWSTTEEILRNAAERLRSLARP